MNCPGPELTATDPGPARPTLRALVAPAARSAGRGPQAHGRWRGTRPIGGRPTEGRAVFRPRTVPAPDIWDALFAEPRRVAGAARPRVKVD